MTSKARRARRARDRDQDVLVPAVDQDRADRIAARAKRVREAEAAYADKRVALADRVRRPEDALPLRLADLDRVDLLGVPELTEAFLRYLDRGTTPARPRRTQVAALITELYHDHPATYGVLWAAIVDGHSVRAIADDLVMSKSQAHRLLAAGLGWLRARLEEEHGRDGG